jgi:hypothetical protein
MNHDISGEDYIKVPNASRKLPYTKFPASPYSQLFPKLKDISKNEREDKRLSYFEGPDPIECELCGNTLLDGQDVIRLQDKVYHTDCLICRLVDIVNEDINKEFIDRMKSSLASRMI